MTVATRKAAAGKADRLWSLIVRSRGRCQYPGCDYVCSCENAPRSHTIDCRLDAAHIIRRGAGNWTRTDEDNGLCMCKTHHWTIDNYADEMMMVIDATIGRSAYDDLRQAANIGVNRKMDWLTELDRLKVLWLQIGGDL